MKSLLGQTSGYYRINSKDVLFYIPAQTRGRAGKKRKQRRRKCLVKGTLFHSQFYLDKAVAEAVEWGTAVGSGTEGIKEQSLYHSH